MYVTNPSWYSLKRLGLTGDRAERRSGLRSAELVLQKMQKEFGKAFSVRLEIETDKRKKKHVHRIPTVSLKWWLFSHTLSQLKYYMLGLTLVLDSSHVCHVKSDAHLLARLWQDCDYCHAIWSDDHAFCSTLQMPHDCFDWRIHPDCLADQVPTAFHYEANCKN